MIKQYFQILTNTATHSCWDPGTAIIHVWLPGCVRPRLQRVTSASSGGRHETIQLPLLQIRPGATAAAFAAAAADAAVAAAGAAV